ncbi:unnamed protein product [Xylocopa violacea]|uniref:Uncharacterized protein n=1 Tax=Xylocopa violacea TaxID=135666 RepID=A0ABP1NH13_XYLVO
MRARGSTAAGLLLLILCLAIRLSSARVAKRRRTETSSLKETELPGGRNARHINDEILSLAETQNVAPKKSKARTKVDQQTEQSILLLLNAEDMKNLDSIEHALSIADYEPQKINKKEKRKIDINPDIVVPNNENGNLKTSDTANIYNEVPRKVQVKKILVLPQYYSRSAQNAQKQLETEPKAALRNAGNAQQVATPNPVKQTVIKARSPANLQATVRTDARNLEKVAEPRISPSGRQYSSPPMESRRQQQYIDPVTTDAPVIDVSQSADLRKSKKGRKKMVYKHLQRQEPSRQEEYNDDTNESEVSVVVESKNKPKRQGLVQKYDVAPRAFLRAPKKSQEESLEVLATEEIASGVNRGSNNRSPHPNTAKNNDGGSNDYVQVVDPVRRLNKQFYDRPSDKQDSTAKVEADPSPSDRPKPPNKPEPFKPREDEPDRPSSPHKDHQASQESDSSEERNSNSEATSDTSKYSSESNEDAPSKAPPRTLSNLDVYQNARGPIGTASPITSTVAPGLHPVNYVYYPPLLSSMQRFATSSMYPWSHTRGEPSLRQQKERNEKTRDDGEGNNRGVVDGQAEATQVAVGQELKDSGKDDTLNASSETSHIEVGDHDQLSHEYIQDEEQVADSGGEGSSEHVKVEAKEQSGHAQKVEDAQSDGTHDSESHQSKHSAKEHAGGGEGKGDSGPKKFEKGESMEMKEEHRETKSKIGEQGYKSWHEHAEANKGHQDKEKKSNYFDETDGEKKEHKEQAGYYNDHEEDEEGSKAAEFGEKGKHQKGYSTKGQHSVHKKDEFDKHTEFFDEFHEDGDMEKDGGFHQEQEMSKGGHHKVGHHDEADHDDKYGKESKYMKGGHHDGNKGHQVKEGKDTHFEHKDMHGEKEEFMGGKKWAYKTGDDGGDGGKKKDR